MKDKQPPNRPRSRGIPYTFSERPRPSSRRQQQQQKSAPTFPLPLPPPPPEARRKLKKEGTCILYSTSKPTSECPDPAVSPTRNSFQNLLLRRLTDEAQVEAADRGTEMWVPLSALTRLFEEEGFERHTEFGEIEDDVEIYQRMPHSTEPKAVNYVVVCNAKNSLGTEKIVSRPGPNLILSVSIWLKKISEQGWVFNLVYMDEDKRVRPQGIYKLRLEGEFSRLDTDSDWQYLSEYQKDDVKTLAERTEALCEEYHIGYDASLVRTYILDSKEFDTTFKNRLLASAHAYPMPVNRNYGKSPKDLLRERAAQLRKTLQSALDAEVEGGYRTATSRPEAKRKYGNLSWPGSFVAE